MTRICHVLDGSVGWEHRVALSQLFDRLPPDGFSNELTAVDARPVAYLRGLDRPIELLQGGKGIAAFAGWSVARRIRRGRFELVHAWGLRAALAAGAARSAAGIAETPLVIELFDPGLSPRQIKMLRVLSRASRVAIVASCQRLIRTLVEGGVRPDVCVLIRPGVDFGLINRTRRGSLRAELGLSSDHNVIIVPDPATRQGGRWEEFWSAKLVSHLDPNLRLVVPGDSPDLSRIERQARLTPGEPVLIAPRDRHPFEQLVAIADTLVVGARGDVPTTALAWAMASETLIIATAVYSVAELIANKLNGLLCTPARGGRLAIPMAKLLMDAASYQNLNEVARAQAYEVFSVRRYVEQHVRLYENILHDRPLSEKIEDPALMI